MRGVLARIHGVLEPGVQLTPLDQRQDVDAAVLGEQVIEGVSQSQARPGTEFDFARGLRSLLRQDPEVIMIGEVRDAETAAIAIEAALTGHLVFSTLHTNDAPGATTRMIDMGIEPYLVASSLEMVLAQRLVRLICKHCKEEAPRVLFFDFQLE